jgi:RNA polymerase sigma-70 factor (ECF subfamily)
VLRYQLEAVRTAYLITRDRASAEDAVQTVFLRFAQRIDRFDLRRPFAPYLFRSVTHEAIKAAQRRERHLSLDAEHGETETTLADLLPDFTNDPAEQFDQAEIQRIVWEAMGQLPPKQRAAAVLRYYWEWSAAEISDALDIPLGTVKWRLYEASRHLRRLLTPYLSAALVMTIVSQLGEAR